MNKRILTSSLTGLILGLMFSFSAAAETSVQSNHTAANATATTKTTETTKNEQPKIDNLSASQAEMLQDNISALRMQVMNNEQQNLNWWMTFITIIFAVAGIVIAAIGVAIPLLLYKKEKRQLEQSLEQAKEYVEKIKKHHDSAEKYTQGIAEMKQWNPKEQNQEAQTSSIAKAKQLSTNEDIPLIEQLRAQAILLSDKANQSQSHQDHLQAFYAWQAVLQQDNQDGQANFNAGLQACFLYDKSNRNQQVYWLKESLERYKKVLQINSASDESAENIGTLFYKEALTLLQEKKIDKAKKLWEQAEKYYRYTLTVNPISYSTVKNWLIFLLNKHGLLKTDELQRARYLIDKFLNDYPQFENELAYINACLHALEGNTSEAIAQLRSAQQENDLPEIAVIKESEFFNNIRHTPEFQAWFKEAFPESSAES
ncbi:hypothetical protein [Neisseria dumasiana]|uniref:hypothetical protein n=1 Tax=Neisseria dumasiana TaxID=1931275 RepID=UPI000A1956BA|nr:hypothetical protein [Neisseria dumasiana]OSI14423.1 hypothetical protein BV914_10200 [Neisseria dumasiana]